MGKFIFTYTIISKRFTIIFASLFTGIGLVVLFGWYSGLIFLTRLSPVEVSMAPSTAYAFIGLAACLWFSLCPQNVAFNRKAAISLAITVICLSSGLFVTNIFKYYSEWEYAFIHIPETQLGMPLGHMSLVTALLFIFSGFALLFLQNERKILRNYSSIFTLGILIFSSILLLGYGFGDPFFYFGSFIPPASLTVLSFLLVSLSLIAASDKEALFVKTIKRASTSARLLRIFLPTILALMVIEGLIIVRIVPLLNINPAIGISLVTLIVVAAVSIIIPIITKRMGNSLDAALKNLNESEETLRRFMDSATDGFMLFDSELNQVDINDAALKITHQKKEDVIGKNILQLEPDVETTGRYGKYKKVISSGTPIIIDDMNLYSKFGDKHVSLKAFRVGSGLGMIITDITDSKQAELKLKQMALFAELNPAPVLRIDRNGIIISSNTASIFIIGKEASIGSLISTVLPEFADINFLEIINSEKERKIVCSIKDHIYQFAVLGNLINNFINIYGEDITERRQLEKTAEKTQIETRRLLTVSEKSGQVLLSVIEDEKIARKEIKDLNNELEHRVLKRTSELEAANKELEAFSYSVSHDLRTPLRAINGFTRILMENYASALDAEGNRLGSIIQKNAKKMGQLIDDLLTFSRMGRTSMKFSEIDMQNMANIIFNELTTQEERSRIIFSITDLHKIEGDNKMMHQVWMNLISNAIKFSANRNQAIISITCREEENKLVYCIKDNGSGFNMKYVDKLFGVFQRLHSEKEFEGTGVGLSLVQRIIHRHEGKVRAEGKVDEGAEFCFTLPKKNIKTT